MEWCMGEDAGPGGVALIHLRFLSVISVIDIYSFMRASHEHVEFG